MFIRDTIKLIQNSPSYTFVNKEGKSEHQGGVAIGIYSCFDFMNISDKLISQIQQIMI